MRLSRLCVSACSVDFRTLEGTAAEVLTASDRDSTDSRPRSNPSRFSASGKSSLGTQCTAGLVTAVSDSAASLQQVDGGKDGCANDSDDEAASRSRALELVNACKLFFQMCRVDEAPIYLLMQVS